MAKIILPAAADWTLGTCLAVNGATIELAVDTSSYNDDFTAATEQNFMTGGDGSKAHGWSVLGTAHADAIDAHTTNAGKLTIDCDADNTGAYNSDLGGVFIYKTLANDFDVSIYISTLSSDANYELIELLARDPDASAGADWVGIGLGFWSTLSPNKNGRGASTVNSSTNENYGIAADTYPYLRLKRVGDDFYCYYSTNGSTWTQYTAGPFTGTGGKCTRATFQDTIQVGISAVTNNTSNTFVPVIDYFHGGTGAYPATSPEAESPWIACAFTTLDGTTPIDMTAGGTGTVNYQYAVNNGAYNGSWLTEANLKAGLANTTITDHTNSVRIKAQFVSNGTQTATMTLTQPSEYLQASGTPSGGGPLVGISALISG